MNRRQFFFGLALIFVLLRLPSFFEPNWYGDEAIYLTLGWHQRLGFIVYRDFYDHKPPLILLISVLLPTIFWAKLLISILLVPTAVCFYRLSGRWLTQTPARLSTLIFLILASIPLFEGNIFNSEIINLFFVVSAFYYYFYRNNLTLPFLLLGLAFTNKFPAVFDLLFLLAYLLANQPNFKNFKKIFISLVLFSLPTLLFSLYFLIHGAFLPYIKAAYLDNLFYISSWGSAGPNLIERLIILLFLLLLVIIFFRFRPQPKYFAWLSAWFLLDLFASLLSSRPYPHYLLQIIPSFSLLLVHLFGHHRHFRYTALLAVILTILVFNVYGFYRYPILPYYRSFYTSIFSRNWSSYSNFFGTQVYKINQLSQDLKSVAPSGSRLLLWADWPQVYQNTGLIPALPYITSFHVSALNQQTAIIKTLESNPPQWVVLVNTPYNALYQFIKKFYLQVAATDFYTIYRYR
jgi:hypothetical protein